MINTDEIVERLRARLQPIWTDRYEGTQPDEDCQEAAVLIEQQRGEIARLEADNRMLRACKAITDGGGF